MWGFRCSVLGPVCNIYGIEVYRGEMLLWGACWPAPVPTRWRPGCSRPIAPLESCSEEQIEVVNWPVQSFVLIPANR
jgi:hypothetical protein